MMIKRASLVMRKKRSKDLSLRRMRKEKGRKKDAMEKGIESVISGFSLR